MDVEASLLAGGARPPALGRPGVPWGRLPVRVAGRTGGAVRSRPQYTDRVRKILISRRFRRTADIQPVQSRHS